MYCMSTKELNSKEGEVKMALVMLNFNSQIKDIWWRNAIQCSLAT